MKDKTGWIRIVEAFVAILLITGALLIIINKGYIEREDITQEVYDKEIAILREIQLNESLRQEILNVVFLPIDSDNSTFPNNVTNKINEKKPVYLECKSIICGINELCDLDEEEPKDIYVQSAIITATTQDYKPRYIKLFCWVK